MLIIKANMPGKCHFQDIWLEKEEYKYWLLKDSTNIGNARCSVCRRTFPIESMGEHALLSHGAGAKHKQLLKMRTRDSGKYMYFMYFSV